MDVRFSCLKAAFRAGSATTALALAGLFAGPAFAQDTGTTPQSTAPQDQSQSTGGAPQVGTAAPAVPVQNTNPGANESNEEIVVTGTIFRRTNTETPSPVTVLSSETLARRGITNVNDAVRSISADNSGSIPNAFSNGFGGGGAAASLRGLTVNSTLTVIDGLRMVDYPLSDDGQRAFVDLNTIPRVAIDRIEVLKDGASSTYGADAIGGVINIIMRKQFQGVDATIEGGMSQHSDGKEYRASVLAGWGDYDAQGFNFYAGAEYEHDGEILARDRGFPFNTGDLTGIGGQNLNFNMFTNCGGSCAGTPLGVATVQPATFVPGNLLTGVAVPGSTFQLLNPASCADFQGTLETGPGGQICTQNPFDVFRIAVQPRSSRWGLVARASVRISDAMEGYLMGSYYRSSGTFWPAAVTNIRSVNPINTRGLYLPPILTNGELNPNNPYANATCAATPEGCPAALIYFRFPNVEPVTSRVSNVTRLAGGINGTFGGGFNYQVDVAAANTTLNIDTTGNVSLSGLQAAIATGSYDFVHPLSNSDAVVNSIIVDNHTTSTSGLYTAQAIATKDLAQLGGGPLQLGVGVQARHEELNNPNANPNNDLINVNQVFARGRRNVYAGFFELSAPIIKQVELNVSGRYDHYSTGFSHFSPKAGIKITPIPQIALRGTYSRGFRAPSFAESGEAGVIGFTTNTPGTREVVCVQHGGTFNNGTCTGGSPYTALQAIGFSSSANPDLKPELSKSFTVGTVVQPYRDLSFTVDYYHIKKTDIITQGPLSATALNNYYAGLPLPPGYSVVLNPADPAFPNGIRTVAIINSPYVNASSLITSGLDVSVLYQHRFSPGFRFSSQLEVTDILKYNFTPCQDRTSAACAVQKYVGTQGPYQLSSGAGTPKWRGNWSTSLELGRATLTGTVNYVSGYWNTAEDITGAGTAHDCAVGAGALYAPNFCHTKHFTDVDFVSSYKFTDSITGYFNLLNAFNAHAPINPPNYAGAAANYNPTWTQAGVVGRFFRIGANFSFRPRPAMAPVEPVVAPPPPPPPAPPPATQTCADGSVVLATDTCPAPPPPPPPPAPEPERG